MQEVTFLRTSALIFLTGVLAIAVALRVVWRVDVLRVLTRQEWILLGRILGIIGMGFLLILRWATQDLPPGIFIYGRF